MSDMLPQGRVHLIPKGVTVYKLRTTVLKGICLLLLPSVHRTEHFPNRMLAAPWEGVSLEDRLINQKGPLLYSQWPAPWAKTFTKH